MGALHALCCEHLHSSQRRTDLLALHVSSHCLRPHSHAHDEVWPAASCHFTMRDYANFPLGSFLKYFRAKKLANSVSSVIM